MTSAKMRALFAAGLTYDEIAAVNERSEGWRPSRSAVSKFHKDLGMPPRHTPRYDLIPWRVAQEHDTSLVHHMLEAESRSRRHKALSDTDRKLVGRLHEILFGRGTLMVVDYHPETGFAFVLREDSDEDVIRQPRSAQGLRRELVAAMRDATSEELAQLAHREGLRPELLENAGRDAAADILRKLLADAPAPSEADSHDKQVDAERPRPRRRAASR